ncbi:MAG: hypothetical protein ACTMIR_12520 [Cellulomonadaceae bacterium]
MFTLFAILTVAFLVVGWTMLALRGTRWDVVDAWQSRAVPHTTTGTRLVERV